MPIGAPELIIILVIALLILGPGKLPDVGSALGKSIREFRKASSDLQESVKVDTSPMPSDAAKARPSQDATPTVATAPGATAVATAPEAPVASPPASPEAHESERSATPERVAEPVATHATPAPEPTTRQD